jgi:lipopolysaccharide export system protein LptC
MRDPYGRRVRILRVAMPIAAGAVLLAVFLFPRSVLFDRLGLSGVAFDPADGLKLLHPRFSGTTDGGQPFSITSDWALPDGPDPTLVTLGPLTGQLSLDGGQVLSLRGAGGHFRPKDRTGRIEGGVTVTSSDGYLATLAAVDFDAGAGTLEGSGPVDGRGPLGTIRADSMRAARRDGGRYIWFEGRVRVVVTPQTSPASEPTRPAGAMSPAGAAEGSVSE